MVAFAISNISFWAPLHLWHYMGGGVGMLGVGGGLSGMIAAGHQ